MGTVGRTEDHRYHTISPLNKHAWPDQDRNTARMIL